MSVAYSGLLPRPAPSPLTPARMWLVSYTHAFNPSTCRCSHGWDVRAWCMCRLACVHIDRSIHTPQSHHHQPPHHRAGGGVPPLHAADPLAGLLPRPAAAPSAREPGGVLRADQGPAERACVSVWWMEGGGRKWDWSPNGGTLASVTNRVCVCVNRRWRRRRSRIRSIGSCGVAASSPRPTTARGATGSSTPREGSPSTRGSTTRCVSVLPSPIC